MCPFRASIQEVAPIMSRTMNKQDVPELTVLAARLDLIRKRHRALILETRAMIAAELDGEFDDPFEEMVEAEELHLVEAAEMGRL